MSDEIGTLDDLISVAEAAIMLGVSEGYVRRLLRTKRIKGRKLTNWTWLVRRQSVEEFKSRREKAGNNGKAS